MAKYHQEIKVKLCEFRSEQIDIHITAVLDENGKLEISGHELGGTVSDSWGEDEYEYWYNFNPEETEKLLEAIDGVEDPAAALSARFSGRDACIKLRDLCEERGIDYDFFSYM